jgi:hypothetical protein
VTSIAERDVEKWQAIDCGHYQLCSTVATGLCNQLLLRNLNNKYKCNYYHTSHSFFRIGRDGDFVAEAVDKIWPFAAVGKFMSDFYIMFTLLYYEPTFVRFQLITRTQCNSLPFC